MRERNNFLVVAICLASVAGAARGAPVVLDDFEGYGVSDNAYLDPTTVPDSGWSRNDKGVGPDWEVACCSGSGNSLPPDYTYDMSDAHLRLRRDDPSSSVLETDLRFDDMSEGSISFEVNPSAIGSSGEAFEAILFDSVTQQPLTRVRFRTYVNNFLGGWEVFAFNRGAAAGVYQNSIGSFPDILDRWWKVTMTAESNSNFSVEIEDIGPTKPVSGSSPFGEGVVLSVDWTDGSIVSVVDTLRLTTGLGNGASNDTKPTMIDNIIQDIVVAAPPVAISGLQTAGAVKISFPTGVGKEYQPEYSDALELDEWKVLGTEIDGDGTTNSVFHATAGVPNRAFRVLDLDPKIPIPVLEDFEYDVGVSNYVDITTLNTNWTAALPETTMDSGTNGPDWEVSCCFGEGNGVRDNAFDGSDGQLSLRRDNKARPHHSQLNTDFDIAALAGGPISNGTIEVQMNPSSVGTSGSVSGEAGAIHLSFHDSINTVDVIRVLYWELDGSNSGDFEAFNHDNEFLGEGTVPNGTASMDRWYNISFTIKESARVDIICEDIGPVRPGISSGDPARGIVFSRTNMDLPPEVTSVDTFRLTTGSQNGGSNETQPTRIDNIAAGPFLRRTGDEIGGLEEPMQAMEIQYPTLRGNFYQPQYTDDGGSTWFNLGPQVESIIGLTLSAFDLVVPGRDYRVLDLRENHAPVANAGLDQTVAVGDTVTLDGIHSYDPDGDSLSYSWVLTSLPAGSAATLNGTGVARTFVPGLAGTYEAQLAVSDGLVTSTHDTVTITAQ